MEITLQKSNQLKALAILMMLCLHLFNRPYEGLFEPLLFVGAQPLSYYISLFCDACVPIFCFVSGYGLYFNYLKNPISYPKGNRLRIQKLYINYWIILFLFVIVLGSVLHKEGYPGNLIKFILNFVALSNSYNSAWWFLFTYILLVLSSPFFFRYINKTPSSVIIIFCIIVYLLAFYSRVYKPNLFNSIILNWFQAQASLYGTSLLPFVIGAVSLKESWNSKISFLFQKLKYKNLVSILCVTILIVIHGFVPNFVVAPFLAIPFIFLYVQINLSDSINNFLDFMSLHATNLWLVHMFFYMIFFEEFIYSPKYVVPIFLLLTICCLIISLLINRINKMILQKFKL